MAKENLPSWRASLRYLLNMSSEKPKAQFKGVMDESFDKNGITTREHLEELYQYLSGHSPTPKDQEDLWKEVLSGWLTVEHLKQHYHISKK